VKRRRLSAQRLKGLTVPENSDATTADTSSAPAASNPVVGAAAAALASVSADPMLDRSVAAEAKNSGAAERYDIAILPRQVANTSVHRTNINSVESECRE
jgi:hypothetical protein